MEKPLIHGPSKKNISPNNLIAPLLHSSTMRQELDDLLCQRYPDIFRDRHGDPIETCMGWGFRCGDGWFEILDDLCAEITRQVKAGTMPPVVAMQVKAKFGYLRIYIRGHFNRDANPEAHRLIQLAQERAERTCQECGYEVKGGEKLRHSAMCARCADEVG